METDQLPSRRLILASASPRRQELLRQAGYQFMVRPANVDEDAYPQSILPTELALYLARQKASVVADLFPEDLVLGADTVVALGDEIIGKPADAEDARRILQLLSGTTHIVVTGVCVLCRADQFDRCDRVLSAVRMRQLTARQIDEYIAGGQWAGKAGAYGIQDRDPFVTRLQGDHDNIVGLPISRVAELLAEAGMFPRESESPQSEATST